MVDWFVVPFGICFDVLVGWPTFISAFVKIYEDQSTRRAMATVWIYNLTTGTVIYTGNTGRGKSPTNKEPKVTKSSNTKIQSAKFQSSVTLVMVKNMSKQWAFMRRLPPSHDVMDHGSSPLPVTRTRRWVPASSAADSSKETASQFTCRPWAGSWLSWVRAGTPTGFWLGRSGQTLSVDPVL